MAKVDCSVSTLVMIKEEPNEWEACNTFNSAIIVNKESSFEQSNSTNVTNLVKSPIIPSTNENVDGFNVIKLSKSSNEKIEDRATSCASHDSESHSCLVQQQNKSMCAQYPEETLGSLLLAPIKDELLTDTDEYDSDTIHDNNEGSLLHYILEGEHSEDTYSDKEDQHSIELNLSPEVTLFKAISPVKKPEVDQKFSFDSPLLEDATLSCSLCSFTTDKRRTLEYHQRRHRKRNIFKCMYCNQNYTKYELYSHIQTVHPEQNVRCLDGFRNQNINSGYIGAYKHKCNKCEFAASSALLLKRHIRWHLTQMSSRILCCVGCDFKSTPELVMRHQRTCEAYLLKENANRSTSVMFKEEQCSKENFASIKLEKSENPVAIPEVSICNELEQTYEFLNNNNSVVGNESISLDSPKSRHVHKQNKETVFKCTECPFIADRSLLLKIHIKDHLAQAQNEDPSNLRCPECSYVAINPRRLECHRITHRRFKIFSCAGCGYKSTPITLRYHQSKCKACPENQKIRNWSNFSCPECSYVASCLGNLEKHQKSHERYQIMSCAGCGFRSTPKSLRYHQYKCEACPPNQRNNYLTHFSCSKCSYVATSIGSLEKHERTHEKYRTVYCSGCGFQSTPKALKYHQYKCKACPQRERKPTSFNCSKCSYVATCIGSLAKHQHCHKKYRNFCCIGCGFKSTPKALKYHQIKCKAYAVEKAKNPIENAIPIEDPPKVSTKKFGCPECSYVAVNTARLELHQKTHRKYPVLSCAGCGFQSTPKSLRFHQKKCEHCPQKEHIKNRSYFNCSKCSYVAKSSRTLEHHYKSHEKCQTVPCAGCGFKFTPKSLAFHQSKCEACPQYQKYSYRKDFSCSKCSYVATCIGGLERHQNSHKRRPTLSCFGCGFRSTPKSLKFHQDKCAACPEEKKIKYRLNFDYNCPDCSYVTKAASHFTRHVNSHKEFEEILSCVACGFRSTRKYLAHHQYKCEAYLLKQSEDLEENESKGRINFTCPECSFVTDCPKQLERHLNTHKNDRIVSCAGCGFQSAARSLTYHQYKCEAYLLKHVDPNENKSELVTPFFETNPKIYNCSECPFASGSLDKLDRHVQFQHDLNKDLLNEDCSNNIGDAQSTVDSKEMIHINDAGGSSISSEARKNINN